MKQVKKTVFFQRGCAFMLCLSLVVSIVANPLTTRAVPTPGESGRSGTAAYINRCYNSTKNTSAPNKGWIGYAYLVGTDNIAAASWTSKRVAHDIYAVEPGTEIQGETFDAKYYPQDNLEYLKDISRNYGSFNSSGRIDRMSNGAQYVELEGSKFSVVACDKDWVIFWDRGYQSWDPAYAKQGIASGGGCEYTSDIFLQTHPAGFYKVERNKVWLDLRVNASYNHPYNSKEDIPNEGIGVVTTLAKLRPRPNENEKTDWKSSTAYVLPKNLEVTVVSKELVPSQTKGSTQKYYKVSFNGTSSVQNNTVLYMTYKIPGVYYINSRALNFTAKNAKRPEGAELGEITASKTYAYKSRDTGSAQIATLEKTVQLDMVPAESDADWTTVYFSGEKCYVQTKYIKKSKYRVKAISNLVLADIVDGKLVFSWNPGKNNVDYSVAIRRVEDRKSKVLLNKSNYKSTTFTVARKYMTPRSWIYIHVRANDKNGEKGKEIKLGIRLPQADKMTWVKRVRPEKKKISFPYFSRMHSIQYSTNKNFKNAKILEGKPSKSTGNYPYYSLIKKLKPNTTYYIRNRGMETYKTAAGDRHMAGVWTKAIKVKTKKK